MKKRPEFVVILLVAAIVTVGAIQLNVYHFVRTQDLAATVSIVSFAGALAWVKSAGYFLMFVAMVIEGPIISAAAAFAAALGYFNIFIVFALSVLGDLVGDFAYYGIGYFGRISLVEKYGAKVGLTAERMAKMEDLIKTHPKKTIAAIKLAPMIPAPGLMMIGAIRMSFKNYAIMTLLVTLPKTIIFVLIGYYFGAAYDSFARYLQNGEYFVIAAIIITIAAYYLYKKLSERISLRLEKV